ncbi:hypothetical protein ACFQY0_17130 [Haloferula chungangensis]|uniref:Anti-sigma factor n=1 Tax=Haloferula chungangensis TaxID=1048331 RepID=A0ABW2LBZ8_9BACT
MNTKPDDELLALWVEDELSGESLSTVDAWASEQSEWLERREQARSWKSLIGGVLPASEEVPHAEFFNARISREIEASAEAVPDAAQQVAPKVVPMRSTPKWAWFLPAAAAAGMVFGFVIGRGGPEVATDGAKLPTATLAPVLYTPTQGVKAEYVSTDDATVIVLAGVDAIPDSWEIPETAVLEKEGPRTASRELK